MRKDDVIFLTLNFSTMALGAMMPFLAEPMAWVPRVTLMIMFLLSFLSVDSRDVWLSLKQHPGALLLLGVIKLLVMPVLCWAVFQLVLPEFALGAALIGGASSAVAAPLFALMMQADFILVLAGIVVSSLLLPFALPFVLDMLSRLWSGGGVEITFPVWAMMLSLVAVIIAPFLVSRCLQRSAPAVAKAILSRRTSLFLACMGLANISIFSRYSGVLMSTPDVVLKAVAVACFVSTVLFCASAALTWWMPPDKQMAVVISCVSVNSLLMLILSVEFFSVSETLLTALYAVPFYGSILLYRLLRHLRC